MVIIYPPDIIDDRPKLEEVYKLIEQIRLDYNAKSAEAARSKLNFQAYAASHKDVLTMLLVEQLRFRAAILALNYTPEEWDKLQEDPGKALAEFERMFGIKGEIKILPPRASSPEVTKLLSLSPGTLPGITPTDPYEDWTTYTEVDGGVLTVTANHIEITNIQRQSGAIVYDDKASDHFGTAFEHLVEGVADSIGGIWSVLLFFWALANVNNADYSTDPCSMIWAGTNGTNLYLYLETDDGAISNTDNYNAGSGNWGTRYYCTIARTTTTNPGDTLTCYICTGAHYGEAGSTLQDTLVVTTGSTTYQYIYGTMSRGGTAVDTATGDVYNLDLQEPAAFSGLPSSQILLLMS